MRFLCSAGNFFTGCILILFSTVIFVNVKVTTGARSTSFPSLNPTIAPGPSTRCPSTATSNNPTIATLLESNITVFDYTGNDQYVIVPSHISRLFVYMWGGGGAGGGSAAYVEGQLSVA